MIKNNKNNNNNLCFPRHGAKLLFCHVGMDQMAWKVLLQILAKFAYASSQLEKENINFKLTHLPWDVDDVWISPVNSFEISMFMMSPSFWENWEKKEKNNNNNSIPISYPFFLEDSSFVVEIDSKDKGLDFENLNIDLHIGHIFFHFLLSLEYTFRQESNYPETHDIPKYVSFLLSQWSPFDMKMSSKPSKKRNCGFCHLVSTAQLPRSTFSSISMCSINTHSMSINEEELFENLGFVYKYFTEEFEKLSASASLKSRLWNIMMNGIMEVEYEYGITDISNISNNISNHISNNISNHTSNHTSNHHHNPPALAFLKLQQQIIQEFPFMKFPSKLVIQRIFNIRQAVARIWSCRPSSVWDLWFLTFLYRAPFTYISHSSEKQKTVVLRHILDPRKTENMVVERSLESSCVHDNDNDNDDDFIQYISSSSENTKRFEIATKVHPCVRVLREV